MAASKGAGIRIGIRRKEEVAPGPLPFPPQKKKIIIIIIVILKESYREKSFGVDPDPF